MNIRPAPPVARLCVRDAISAADLLACQRLRHRCFFGRDGVDADAHDDVCRHLMVEQDGALLGTARYLVVQGAADLRRTLTARSYDLSGFARLSAPIIELGRFCAAPGPFEAVVIRQIMGALTARVDAVGAGTLLGCTSFKGSDPARHRAALALLGRYHVGHPDIVPRARVSDAVALTGPVCDRRAGVAGFPPLLRSYLAMGGWVGPQAVIDRAMQTVHVFTCVEIDRIPPARIRALRALAV